MQEDGAHSQPLITLDRIAIRVRERHLFSGACWEIDSGQHWAVIGPNGSGKTSLVRALAGQLPLAGGRIHYHDPGLAPPAVGYLSFESHQNLMAREAIRDDARFFSGDFGSFLSVRQLLLSVIPSSDCAPLTLDQVAERLEMAELLDRPVSRLSTGEVRRVLMAREILKSPRLLILDEPFDGLDSKGRQLIKVLIKRMIKRQVPVILVTHRLAEVPSAVTHLLALKNGRMVYQGKRPPILNQKYLDGLYGLEQRRATSPPIRLQPGVDGHRRAGRVLIDMHEVTVRYGHVTVLDKLNWTVRAGENWAIIGPNGSGKTTLLSLVAGDNLQAYANTIDLFGRRRGSGETIWDIKQHLGLVSAEFQIRYRRPLRALEVVVSGFFDSVGLYRQASCRQRRIAFSWMKQLGCADRAKQFFQNLSQGEQRLVLLARAMVKSPLMLILDEPCQGLDRAARRRLLDIFDRIGRESETCLLYVTHYPAEIPNCTTRILRFEVSATGGYRARQVTRDVNRA
ncbi:MAG: ATP-binding cassette domain-containing protein [Desulfobacterales bacterium]